MSRRNRPEVLVMSTLPVSEAHLLQSRILSVQLAQLYSIALTRAATSKEIVVAASFALVVHRNKVIGRDDCRDGMRTEAKCCCLRP